MIPVDVLSFEFVVQDFDDPNVIENAPEEGILIYGIFMDGASWDYQEMVITEQEMGVMFCQAPVIHFVPVQNYKKDPDQYECPLQDFGPCRYSLHHWSLHEFRAG